MAEIPLERLNWLLPSAYVLKSAFSKIRRALAQFSKHDHLGASKTIQESLYAEIEQTIAATQAFSDIFVISNSKGLDLNTMLLYFFLTMGLPQTARLLASQTDLEPLLLPTVFETRCEIHDSLLRDHSLEKVTNWCKENASNVKRVGESLALSIHLQQIVERLKKTGDDPAARAKLAIAAQKACTNRGFKTPGSIEEIKGTMSLLAMWGSDYSTLPASARAMLSEERWRVIADKFLAVHSAIVAPTPPMLQQLVRSGLIALKTTHCKPGLQTSTACPVCSSTANQLATGLPQTAKERSVFICRVTGETINEENPPMALPNGQVFSANGIAKLRSSRADGILQCPITKQLYHPCDIRRVYIL